MWCRLRRLVPPDKVSRRTSCPPCRRRPEDLPPAGSLPSTCAAGRTVTTPCVGGSRRDQPFSHDCRGACSRIASWHHAGPSVAVRTAAYGTDMLFGTPSELRCRSVVRDAACLDERIESGAFQPNVLAELDVRNSPLRHEATDEPLARTEVLPSLADSQQLVVGHTQRRGSGWGGLRHWAPPGAWPLASRRLGSSISCPRKRSARTGSVRAGRRPAPGVSTRQRSSDPPRSRPACPRP